MADGKTWKCELRGRTFYRSDLTLGDADDLVAFVNQGNGAASWMATNPFASPRHAIGVLAVLLRKADPGLSFEQAVDQVRAIGQEAPMFEVVEDDDAPSSYTDGIPDPR